MMNFFGIPIEPKLECHCGTKLTDPDDDSCSRRCARQLSWLNLHGFSRFPPDFSKLPPRYAFIKKEYEEFLLEITPPSAYSLHNVKSNTPTTTTRAPTLPTLPSFPMTPRTSEESTISTPETQSMHAIPGSSSLSEYEFYDLARPLKSPVSASVRPLIANSTNGLLPRVRKSTLVKKVASAVTRHKDECTILASTSAAVKSERPPSIVSCASSGSVYSVDTTQDDSQADVLDIGPQALRHAGPQIRRSRSFTEMEIARPFDFNMPPLPPMPPDEEDMRAYIQEKLSRETVYSCF